MRRRRRLLFIRAKASVSRFAKHAAASVVARLPGALVPTSRRRIPLEQVRRRLELVLTALHGRELTIQPVEPPKRPGILTRMIDRVPAHLVPREPVPSVEGDCIRLPVALDATGGIEHYRLLALEQAARIQRGTALLVPGDDDPLGRDLYLLREAALIDGVVAASVHGAETLVRDERERELQRRPQLDRLTAAEREVETLVRRALTGKPGAVAPELGSGTTPADSLGWAMAEATRIRATTDHTYRGLPPVHHWGVTRPVSIVADATPAPPAQQRIPRPDSEALAIRSGSRGGSSNFEDDAPTRPGANQRRDTAQPSLDPSGATTVAVAEAGARRAELDLPDTPPTSHRSNAEKERDEPVPMQTPRVDATESRDSIWYPEWDYEAGRHRESAVRVRLATAIEGDEDWPARVLREHAASVRLIRHRFERLRARRQRLGRQREGDELDLAAVVRALAERRAGGALDDRLYEAIRPARRAMAIALVVDASGSTSADVTNTHKVIDVEKRAVLLASEALDALGDSYAVLAFNGKGAHEVRLTTLKGFGERNGDVVRRRVAALKPHGYTRLGAAIRHATSLLAAQPVGHRLLLILSDGRPNDVDHYQDRYGVEDSRQAMHEARAADVHPFCLTVDREGSEYLPRIFGSTGHTILRDPDQLPAALLGAVRQLLRS